MASRTVSTLKFVGSISVGLLTGLSYTLTTVSLPTLLTLPSATSASRAFANLKDDSILQCLVLAGLSTSSFCTAYFLSPRSQRHPYLLWTSLFISLSGLTAFLPLPAIPSSLKLEKDNEREEKKRKDRKGKGKMRMDASYEVLGDSEGMVSEEEEDDVDAVNGEIVRGEMERFRFEQVLRMGLAGVGFAMSVVGIWGDGASDLVIIEL